MTLIHISEITGTDKPILVSKEKDTFTYEEIIYIQQNTSFEHVAFITTDDETLFNKLYSKNV